MHSAVGSALLGIPQQVSMGEGLEEVEGVEGIGVDDDVGGINSTEGICIGIERVGIEGVGIEGVGIEGVDGVE